MAKRRFTFEEAVAFIRRTGNFYYEGKEANKPFYCTVHKKVHRYGFWQFIVGGYTGFDTKKEIIEWAERLWPNSIDGLSERKP